MPTEPPQLHVCAWSAQLLRAWADLGSAVAVPAFALSAFTASGAGRLLGDLGKAFKGKESVGWIGQCLCCGWSQKRATKPPVLTDVFVTQNYPVNHLGLSTCCSFSCPVCVFEPWLPLILLVLSG